MSPIKTVGQCLCVLSRFKPSICNPQPRAVMGKATSYKIPRVMLSVWLDKGIATKLLGLGIFWQLHVVLWRETGGSPLRIYIISTLMIWSWSWATPQSRVTLMIWYCLAPRLVNICGKYAEEREFIYNVKRRESIYSYNRFKLNQLKCKREASSIDNKEPTLEFETREADWGPFLNKSDT